MMRPFISGSVSSTVMAPLLCQTTLARRYSRTVSAPAFVVRSGISPVATALAAEPQCALAHYELVKELSTDAKLVGSYGAAVIERDHSGEVKIV
jgi:hypothetical protein